MACLPTILGFWSIGFAAGAIGALAGFSVLDITLLAVFLYAGSAQFMFYSLHAAGAGVLAIVLGVMLINMRYVLMSSYMAIYFTGATSFQKFVSGALLTDETFGVAAQQGSRTGELPFAWMLGLNVTAWLNWIVANLAGALLASSLPEPITQGLSFSLVAMFIGLLLMTWFASRQRLPETIAIAISVAVIAATSRTLDVNVGVLLATVAAASISTLLLWRTKTRTQDQ
ncbi:AzlC family ABC transporter permease [Paracoccus kondratievae]|nr:AzlC family ABC transporter permease [Paracoccus kondratievae]